MSTKQTLPCIVINDGGDNPGICGFCHQVVESPVCDDYYDRCVWFYCENCDRTSILCFDYNDNKGKCARKMNREQFGAYCKKYQIGDYEDIIDNWDSDCEAYLAYPLHLNYLVPHQDYDKYSDDLFEDDDYEAFMKLNESSKYKVNAKYLEDTPKSVDISHDGVMLGFIGTCRGCKKTHMGSIWGD